jgi:hypothetical protein
MDLIVVPPTVQTITAGATITANACSTTKFITSSGSVTTSTVDTLTNATTAGCCMRVINTGSNNITLDSNANTFLPSATDLTLGAGDADTLCSDGTKWYSVGNSNN